MKTNPPSVRSAKNPWPNRIATGILFVLALFWLVPLIWSLLISVRPPDEAIVGNATTPANIFIGSRFTLENFQGVLDITNWGQKYATTIIFVLGVLAIQTVTITLAGYAFARLKFFGRNVLFLAILVQLMIPSAVLLLPNFVTVQSLHLYDTRLGLMLPYFGSAFGTFLMRQTFKQVPLDL